MQSGRIRPTKNGRIRRLRGASATRRFTHDFAATKERTLQDGVGVDRRRHMRLYEPFPAIVRGVDANGESFEVNTVLDNISAGGLYVRLGRCVKRGTRFFVLVRLSTTPEGWSARVRRGTIFRLCAKHGARVWGWIVRRVRGNRETVVRPSISPLSAISGPLVAIRGIATRTEPQPNGMCGVAIAFTHHRFL